MRNEQILSLAIFANHDVTRAAASTPASLRHRIACKADALKMPRPTLQRRLGKHLRREWP